MKRNGALRFFLGFLVFVGIICGIVFLYFENKPSYSDTVKSAFSNIHIDTAEVNKAVSSANDIKERIYEEQENTSQLKSNLDNASKELQNQILDDLAQQGN